MDFHHAEVFPVCLDDGNLLVSSRTNSINKKPDQIRKLLLFYPEVTFLLKFLSALLLALQHPVSPQRNSFSLPGGYCSLSTSSISHEILYCAE